MNTKQLTSEQVLFFEKVYQQALKDYKVGTDSFSSNTESYAEFTELQTYLKFVHDINIELEFQGLLGNNDIYFSF